MVQVKGHGSGVVADFLPALLTLFLLVGYVSQPNTVFADDLVFLFGRLRLLFESRMGE